MSAGKPASQAEETPMTRQLRRRQSPPLPAVRQPRRVPHLAPPVSSCMLKRALEHSLREPRARHDNYVGVEHLTLAPVAMNQAVAPPTLSALRTSQATLRAAILDRYRQAS